MDKLIIINTSKIILKVVMFMLKIHKNSVRIIIGGAVIFILGIALFSAGYMGRITEYTRPEVSPTPIVTPEVTPTLAPTENPTIDPTDSPLPTQKVYEGVVKSDSNVRSKPTTGSETLGSIDEGTSITVYRLLKGTDTSNDFDWYEISYSGASSGKAYMAEQLVECDNLLTLEEYTD